MDVKRKQYLLRVSLQSLSVIYGIFGLLYVVVAILALYSSVIMRASWDQWIFMLIFVVFFLLVGYYILSVAYRMLRNYSRKSIKDFSLLISLSLFSLAGAICVKNNALEGMRRILSGSPLPNDYLRLAPIIFPILLAILFYTAFRSLKNDLSKFPEP